MPNVFSEDDTFQRQKRDSVLVPFFYDRYFSERYVLLDGQMKYQKRGIDTIIYTGANKPVYVEEKIVRQRYTAFALETHSCTVPGYESPGWMIYGEADRLLYCFTVDDGLECWWINFPAMRTWFWEHENDFRTFQMPTENRSAGRVVPIDAVSRFVQKFDIRDNWERMWTKPYDWSKHP